jgi:hypothetical protein
MHAGSISPLPRHLHDSCCECGEHCTNVGKEGHAEKLLGELSGIRTALENNLNALGVKNFSVPDTLKLMMPACAGISEMSLALKHFIKKDGVHFTEDGIKCLANGYLATPSGSHLVPRNKILPESLLFQVVSRELTTGGDSSLRLAPAGQPTTTKPTCKAMAVMEAETKPSHRRTLGANGPKSQKGERPHTTRHPIWVGPRGAVK